MSLALGLLALLLPAGPFAVSLSAQESAREVVEEAGPAGPEEAGPAGPEEAGPEEAPFEPRTWLRTGRSDELVRELEGIAGVDTVDLLAAALIERGRYAEAESALRRLETAEGFRSFRALGELLELQGRSEEARPYLVAALRTGERLQARFALASLDRDQGHLDAARDGFYSLIDAYNHSSALSAAELTAVGRACQALGNDNHQLFKDALKAYDEAVATDPSDLEPRLRLGELFLEKYDSTQARSTIADVLEVNPQHPEALLVMARILHFDGSYEAMEVVDQALRHNPRLVPGLVFRAQLFLELEDYDRAKEEASAALEVNAESLDAFAVLAASHFLQGDETGFDEVTARALELNPHYADFFNLLADASVRNRLYREAVQFARRAVQLDPLSWRGHGLEGLNLLRLGEIEAGRAKLELAFEGDPYNVWFKNTLDLLDTFPQYRSSRSGKFELFIHEEEAEILAPYMSRLAEEAYEALAKRYRYEPATPLRIEVFPSHADFSVRTVGLAGLGALGVCFGPVIAVDSPSARPLGSFNWGSTLWHELAHTFTLEVSGHRVPRWLTEGLSVLEERHARSGWGDDPRADFLRALEAGELLPLAELNNGFVRPTSPVQIAHSYYQASLVAELLEREYGFDKVLALLHGYGDDKGTEELFAELFELDLESFDDKFFDHLEERFGSQIAALGDPEEEPPASPEELAERADTRPRDFRAQLAHGTRLFAEERFDEAIPFLRRARELVPEFAYEGNAYAMLAEIHRQREETALAIRELEALTAINEMDFASHVLLADLLAETGDRRAELEVLERTFFIYPLDIDLHVRVAELYQGLGESAGVIRERAAVVALDPPDRAEALYRLAVAFHLAGDHATARRQVLRALEIAPSFDNAQRLLLQLHRGES